MNTENRKKLEMATRVRDFTRAHPYATADESAILTRLEDRITRAEELDALQRDGLIAVHASTAHRSKLRRSIRRQLLRHLARVAEAASKAEPELATAFVLPRQSINQQTFLTAARSMTKEATARQELFLKNGMAPTLLDELAQALDQYNEAINQFHAGRRDHVGAGAELNAVIDELVTLVHQLDGMNLFRFRNDPEQLAVWDSMRNVVWPIASHTAPPAPPGQSIAPAA